MAALTILSHETSVSELSLQQHLEIAPDLAPYRPLATEADSEPLMMAQQVPHQATDKKRVKVYELRDNDWYDRGTGFCTATYTNVCTMPSSFLCPCHNGRGGLNLSHVRPCADVPLATRPKMAGKIRESSLSLRTSQTDCS